MQEIERPAAEKRKIHSKNEFELCYIRHQYFRRVKYNPTQEEMAPYQNIIRYTSQRNYYTYASLFKTIGMNLEDSIAIGTIHLVNFIGLFEMGPVKNVEKYRNFVAKIGHEPTSEELLNKNKADLTLFMKQRWTDVIRIFKQKAKNIKGLRVDEYIPFYGPSEPPEDTYKLLEDNEAYGFKRLDSVQFKAIKKKVRAKKDKPFQWAGNWYVTVPLEQRNLTVLDLAGAGLDPYESEHNLNPEQLLCQVEDETRLDNQIKMFKNYSKEDKAKVILGFIEKNTDNPKYKEEILTARKLLRTLGIGDAKDRPLTI